MVNDVLFVYIRFSKDKKDVDDYSPTSDNLNPQTQKLISTTQNKSIQNKHILSYYKINLKKG